MDQMFGDFLSEKQPEYFPKITQDYLHGFLVNLGLAEEGEHHKSQLGLLKAVRERWIEKHEELREEWKKFLDKRLHPPPTVCPPSPPLDEKDEETEETEDAVKEDIPPAHRDALARFCRDAAHDVFGLIFQPSDIRDRPKKDE